MMLSFDDAHDDFKSFSSSLRVDDTHL